MLAVKGIGTHPVPLTATCITGSYDMAMDNKVCTKCHESKPVSEFPPSENHRFGVRNECRDCTRSANREREARKSPKSVRALNYRLKADGLKHCVYCDETKPLAEFQKNGDSYRGKCLSCAQVGRMKSNFGITRSQYGEMLAAQGGGCAICGSQAPGGGRGAKKFYVDHDHSCCPGRTSCGACVRGLLCNGCNLTLGVMRDNTDRLRAAITYLEVHGATA